MNDNLRDKGFVIIKSVFDRNQISEMRKICLGYFQNGGGFSNAGGLAKPDWIKEKSLSKLLQIYDTENIRNIVSDLVSEEVSFVGHNDLHLNRNVGWHKDRLNGEARRFEIHSPWQEVDGDTMKMFKVNLYLQDHSKNNDGLIVRSGSHKWETLDRGIVYQIKPKSGDIVLFDQRITHMAKWSGGYDRILICMGFGVKNIFFEEFQKGTIFRQNNQNNKSEGK